MTVRRSKFVGQSWAGIGDYAELETRIPTTTTAESTRVLWVCRSTTSSTLGRCWRLLISAD